MDGWTQKLDRLRSLLRGFSTIQRVSLCVVSLLVLACCCWFGFAAYSPKQEFLLGGKSFSKEELTKTLEAFKAAGLTQHRVEGQKISVPAAEADKYTAAAVAQKALPAQFAAEFDRMQSRVNVFTSSEQRRELLEEARKTRLAQILRAIPEIEDAVVEWDRPKSTSLFRPQVQLAAHVSVRPRDGRELSLELVQSLKQFIAGALAGASPEDVTVVDLNTSRVHGRRTNAEAASDRIQSLVKQSSEEVTQQVTQALRYIPDVLVSVNVELLSEPEDIPSEAIDVPEIVPVNRQANRSASRSGNPIKARSNRPVVALATPVSSSKREFPSERKFRTVDSFDSAEDLSPVESGLHKSVQVAISIPEDYYFAIAQRQGISQGRTLVADSEYRAAVANIKIEAQRDIRDKLIRLLPLGTSPEAISITSYSRLGTALTAEVTTKQPVGSIYENRLWVTLTAVILTGACGFWLIRRLFLNTPRHFATAGLVTIPEATPSTAETVPFKAAEPLSAITMLESAAPTSDAINPFSAILNELAERERDTVVGAPGQGGMFEFLCRLTPVDAADFLRTEHPQTIALVATGIPPTRAAEILHALPDALRSDVKQRITRLSQAASDDYREVAQHLAARLLEQKAKRQEQAASVENNSNNTEPMDTSNHSSIESAIPFRLSGQNAGTFTASAETRTVPDSSSSNLNDNRIVPLDRGPVSFEDLCVLDRLSFAAVLRTVDSKTFAIALFDRSEPFKQKFMSLLPRPLAAAILQQTRSFGPLRLSDITASQHAIAAVIWNLSLQGAISLPPHLNRHRPAAS